jgi:D-serine deaminase-like pyridoxal phosphate-dependent protein
MQSMNIQDLATPTALIDEARMQHNIQRMQQRMNELGVKLRPHVKTAKCVEVALQQQQAGASGITVSTLKEAEVFFAAGFMDILYAVCITPNKLAQAHALRAAGCELTVTVDSLAAAQAVVASGQKLGHRFGVMIEIDTDGHRAGVLPDADLLLEIGRTLHAGGAASKGVMTHAGASYECRTPVALQAMAEQERSRCVRAAQRLRDAGLPCPVVSVGSTPTALSALSLEGVTEVRAGVYIFHDLVMQGVGVCGSEEIALSVLATVIGHQLDKGWVLVDAGWMAMSRDRGTQDHAVDWGYGAVCDENGALIEGVFMSGANQEHGILSWRNGSAQDATPSDFAARFPVGSRVRVLPNHACATAAQFPHYEVLGVNGEWRQWSRFSGW